MSVVNKSVLMHSCRIEPKRLNKLELAADGRYIEERHVLPELDLGTPTPLQKALPEPKLKEGEPTYCRLQFEKCKCRNWITLSEANDFYEVGKAMKIFRIENSIILRDESLIWMPVTRERVPRVDLFSRADIERAFIGSSNPEENYRFNKEKRKYVPTASRELALWRDNVRAGIEFEQKFRRKFENDLEEWHKMYLAERVKLIRYWDSLEDTWERTTGKRVDPFDGRQLLAFGPDQRT